MPAKGGATARRNRPRRVPRYRRPAPAAIRTAALEVVRSARGAVASQGALVAFVRRRLRRDEPLAALGGRHLRYLLIGMPGVRVDVVYAERAAGRPLSTCPVCGGALRPIPNRTLDGGGVVLGYRCRTCAYWTHLKRRVPVRYVFRAAGGAPAAGAPPATPRRSA